MRMLHRFIWLQHGLWLYVDDGMLLLPKSVAPLVGGAAVMFLCFRCPAVMAQVGFRYRAGMDRLEIQFRWSTCIAPT